MCAERDPLDCHRCLLVSRELVSLGLDVQHIHADGRLEAHTDALRRLLKQLRLPQRDLFRTEHEMIEEGYSRQERRVAYVTGRQSEEVAES